MGEVSSCKLAPPTLRIDKARKRENKNQTKKHNKPGSCFSITTMLTIGRHPETKPMGWEAGSQQSYSPVVLGPAERAREIICLFFPLNELIREDHCQPLSQYAL